MLGVVSKLVSYQINTEGWSFAKLWENLPQMPEFSTKHNFPDAGAAIRRNWGLFTSADRGVQTPPRKLPTWPPRVLFHGKRASAKSIKRNIPSEKTNKIVLRIGYFFVIFFLMTEMKGGWWGRPKFGSFKCSMTKSTCSGTSGMLHRRRLWSFTIEEV